MIPDGDQRMTVIPTLRTERLELRPFTDDDIARVTELLQGPETAATTLYIPYPYSRDDAAEWIARHPGAAEAGTDLTWAIRRREDGLLIGAIGIQITSQHRRGALGYWLDTLYWSRGYMSEAARAVVEYGFAELDLHRIEASRRPENIGSARVMENVGLAARARCAGTISRAEFLSTPQCTAWCGMRNDRASHPPCYHSIRPLSGCREKVARRIAGANNVLIPCHLPTSTLRSVMEQSA